MTTFDNSDTAAGTKDSGALDSRSKTSGSLMSDEHIAKEGSNASDKPDAEPPRLYCCRSETSSHAAPPRFVVGVIGSFADDRAGTMVRGECISSSDSRRPRTESEVPRHAVVF